MRKRDRQKAQAELDRMQEAAKRAGRPFRVVHTALVAPKDSVEVMLGEYSKIGSDYPLANPLALDDWLWVRKHEILSLDPLPRPQHDNPNDRRRTNWRPVYEWHLRHPEFKQIDIAKLLRKSPKAVSQAFAPFDVASR